MARHFVRTQDLSREDLDRILFHARNIEAKILAGNKKKLKRRLKGKTVTIVFWEASTRTAQSFIAAAQLLGATVNFTADASVTSSAAKGETFEHTIRMLASYHPDVLVIRHKEMGRLAEAARIIDHFGHNTRVVNAGDGPGQHPTQALLDLYTIQQKLGRVGHIRIMMGGDLLNGRTVRSLAYLLSKYKDVEIVFAAPEELQISVDILEHLTETGVKWSQVGENFRQQLPRMHAVYWTRLQTERIADTALRERLQMVQKEKFCIGVDELGIMQADSILMHPLPINSQLREISSEAERDYRCVMIQQAANGLWVRAALLDILVNGWPNY